MGRLTPHFSRFVVRQQVVDLAILADLDDLRANAIEANPLIAILAEDHRLAVFEVQTIVRLH